MLERLRLDVAFAARAIGRRPAFALLVVATFGLGIGSATAMFSVVNAVLLRPLPYPDPERVVSVYPTLPEWRNTGLHEHWERASFSYPEFNDYRRQQTTLETMAAFSYTRRVLLDRGEPERLQIGIASPELFPMLGVRPHAGRLFGNGEDAPVIIVSHGLWQRRFGGDPNLIGQKLQLGADRFEVVGILPAPFEVVGFQADLWRSAAGNFDEHDRDNHNYQVLARLRPGVTVEQASAQAAQLLAALSVGHDLKHGGWVVSRREDLTESYRFPLLILIGAAFVLLLAACASVAAMLLGAGMDRESEIAIRAAMGAPRHMIVRQLLTEGTMLGAAGGGLGILVAALLMRFLLLLAPTRVPRIEDATLDLRVLTFAIAGSLLFAMFFSIVPAIVVSNANLAAPADATRVTRRARGRLQFALVTGQIALATVLLISAGLLTRTMQRFNAVDPGFDPDGLITVQAPPDYARMFDVNNLDFSDRVSAHFQQIVDEVSAIPGVDGVAVAATMPFSGDRATNDIVPEEYKPAPGEQLSADRRFVSANYFAVMRMRFVEGRGFTEADDRRNGSRVVVVNQSLARRFWPGQSALGKRLRFWDDEPWTIIGVVQDARERDLRGDAGPNGEKNLKFYTPGKVRGSGSGSLIIRSRLDLAQLAPIIRQRIWSVDATVPVTSIATMRSRMGESIAEQRYRMRLILAFSVLAAIFAVMGVHGVLSRSTARRRRELGVRAALGAVYSDLLALILKQAVLLSTAGIAAGLVLGAFATRILESMLFETRRADPLTIAAIIMLLLGLTLVASWQPARRAARVDPMLVLRSD